jgi:hypothetical protein
MPINPASKGLTITDSDLEAYAREAIAAGIGNRIAQTGALVD